MYWERTPSRSVHWIRRLTICGARNWGSPSTSCGDWTSTTYPLSDYTIGIDKIDVMVAKMKEFPIGRSTRSSWELPMISKSCANCRKHTDAVFRVDANCAWTVEETIRNSHELKSLNVQFIEQPMAADQWEAHGACLSGIGAAGDR